MKTFLQTIVLLFLSYNLSYSQCSGGTQWPTSVVKANYFDSEIEITTSIYAGEFSLLTGLQVGETYQLRTSASPNDYITVYDDNGNLMAHGQSPLVFENTDTYQDTIKAHVNLLSPPCGTEDIIRSFYLRCTSCDSPNNIAINGEAIESAALSINGDRQGLLPPRSFGDIEQEGPTPVNGLMYYNLADEELRIHSGGEWKSILSDDDKTKVINISAYDFFPISESDAYSTSSSTGRYSSQGSDLYAGFTIPEGSVIKKVTYIYYDNSNTLEGEFSIVRSNSLSNSTTLSFIYSTGQSFSSPLLNFETIESTFTALGYHSFYVRFEIDNSTNSSNIRVKSVRIEYEEP